MSLGDEYLHHPRPVPGRGPAIVSRAPTSSTSVVQTITHPNIQYPVTPVPRPSAPPPSRPEIRIGHSANAVPQFAANGQTQWKVQSSPDRYRDSPSPPGIRRDGRLSSQNMNFDEHGSRYPEATRGASHSAVKPSVLRQRSASSPEHLKTYGAYEPYHQNDVPSVPVSALSSKSTKTVGGSVHFTPDNLFVSLSSSDTLKVYNLTPSNNGPNVIMDALRSQAIAFWPKGTKLDDERRGEWTVRFNGNIWTSKGAESIVARRMICRLFGTLALQGYSYLCSIQNTHPFRPSSHLFTSSPPCRSRFFSLCFSLNQRKLTLMDAPSDLNVTISNALKNATLFDVDEIDEVDGPAGNEKQATTDGEGTEEDHDNQQRIFTYRLTKRRTVSRGKNDVQLFLTRNEKADILMLLSQLLKIIAAFGYRLDASVPLGSAGLLGLRGRREMWIFKEVSWKVSSNKD